MKYKSATALRHAIQHRLSLISEGREESVQRLRRHLAFERLLARVFKQPSSPWVLKGGYAMELRLQSSRTTRDVDLAVSEERLLTSGHEQVAKAVHTRLMESLAEDLGDFFSFKLKEKYTKLFAPPSGGVRLYVDAILDNKLFSRFHIDVGVGDAEIMPLENLTSRNLLAFAGIDCPPFPSIPREQHFAEKVHAYTTLYNGQMSSRVKDLIDMVLLIQGGKMDKVKLAKVLPQTFSVHKKHALPQKLPTPPAKWATKFATLAAECHLELSLEDAFDLVSRYYDELST